MKEDKSRGQEGEYPLPGTTWWLTSCAGKMAQATEKSFAAAHSSGLQETLSQLVQSQSLAQWSKWVKSPDGSLASLTMCSGPRDGQAEAYEGGYIEHVGAVGGIRIWSRVEGRGPQR